MRCGPRRCVEACQKEKKTWDEPRRGWKPSCARPFCLGFTGSSSVAWHKSIRFEGRGIQQKKMIRISHSLVCFQGVLTLVSRCLKGSFSSLEPLKKRQKLVPIQIKGTSCLRGFVSFCRTMMDLPAPSVPEPRALPAWLCAYLGQEKQWQGKQRSKQKQKGEELLLLLLLVSLLLLLFFFSFSCSYFFFFLPCLCRCHQEESSDRISFISPCNRAHIFAHQHHIGHLNTT